MLVFWAQQSGLKLAGSARREESVRNHKGIGLLELLVERALLKRQATQLTVKVRKYQLRCFYFFRHDWSE